MRTYGWSLRHVRLEMTGAQGWVWYNWALENEATAMGPAYKRTTDGYIRQERDKHLKR